MDLINRYYGLDAFYRANPRRRESDGADFGVMWHNGVGNTSYWRVTWVETTGEIYAYELAVDGLVVVMAERLRRPVVRRALAGWEYEHSLLWAWRAVTLPPVTEGFSGYVGQPENRAVWVVRHGWWERPLELTRSSPSTPSNAANGSDTASDPRTLVDSLLADHVGHPVDRGLADAFTSAYVVGWPHRKELVISGEQVARWLERAGIRDRFVPSALEGV